MSLIFKTAASIAESFELKPIISNINKFNDLKKEIKDLQNLLMGEDEEISQIAKKEMAALLG